jgi:ubiquitin carboxyl-terminal hydrolase 7
VQVVDDASFRRHQGFDLSEYSAAQVATFRVPKTEPWQSFKLRISKTFGYAEPQFRLWVLVNRQNRTVRPDIPVLEEEPTLGKQIKHLFS